MADGLAAKTGERLLRVSGEQQDNMGDAECAGDAPQAVHEMLLRSGEPIQPACGTAVPARQSTDSRPDGKRGCLSRPMARPGVNEPAAGTLTRYTGRCSWQQRRSQAAREPG